MSRKTKTAKEVHAAKLQIQRNMSASAAMAVRAVPVETWSARMPAYCYTAACPDPKLREPIWRRGGKGAGQKDFGAVHRCM